MALDGRLLSNVSVLAAVVDSGSFAKAADALGVTPSGVSRAIARLEARIIAVRPDSREILDEKIVGVMASNELQLSDLGNAYESPQAIWSMLESSNYNGQMGFSFLRNGMVA